MNVFISRPTVIGKTFETQYSRFDDFLVSNGFALRRLGGGDYSKKPPLRAVIDLIGECCGAIVLGYPQLEFHNETRRSAAIQDSIRHVFPTPWNQIEGALAYSTNAPVLVVAHKGIKGGVFDHGITGEGVLHIDLDTKDWFKQPAFSQPYAEWLAEVKECQAVRTSGA